MSQAPETPHGHSFKRFPELPTEIRCLILSEAAGPSVLHSSGWNHGPVPNDAGSLLQVNQESREVVRQSHTVRFEADGGETYWLDPNNDVFATNRMSLPLIRPTATWPGNLHRERALPITKLMSRYLFQLPRSRQVAAVDPWQPLDLRYLPYIRQYTAVYQHSLGDSWIKGYKLEGPDVINLPDENVPVHVRPDPDDSYIRRAGTYFDQQGIVGDAAIHWRPYSAEQANTSLAFLGVVRNSIHWAGSSVEGIVRWNFFNGNCPRVGLMGYSYNRVSLGGQWSGFRYNVTTNRVEWSPLSLDEVKEAFFEGIHAPGAFPELIVKIWFTREGEEPYNKPHHAWRPVKAFEQGESEADGQLRDFWNHQVIAFNHQSFGPQRMEMRA